MAVGAKGLAEFDSLPTADRLADSMALAKSGFYLMTDAKSGQQLVIDAGPLGAGSGGHGHADALSVCLVREGRNLLRDPGTFEYVGESGERSRLRAPVLTTRCKLMDKIRPIHRPVLLAEFSAV